MMINWYSDDYAKHTHKIMSTHLEALIEKMMPKYELSHFGINRNDNTEEVIIKLHLNIKGKVKVKSDKELCQQVIEVNHD